jgi:hypothetical protein
MNAAHGTRLATSADDPDTIWQSMKRGPTGAPDLVLLDRGPGRPYWGAREDWFVDTTFKLEELAC